MIYPQGLESCLDKACGKRLKIRMRNEMLNWDFDLGHKNEDLGLVSALKLDSQKT